jgi:hypothetical protein
MDRADPTLQMQIKRFFVNTSKCIQMMSMIYSKKEVTNKNSSNELSNKASVLLNWIRLSYNQFFVLLNPCLEPNPDIYVNLLPDTDTDPGYGSMFNQ